MNVLICSENHFILVGDEVHFPLTGPGFFQRYRKVWDEVIILSRAGRADSPPKGSVPLDMSGIRLACLPNFYGPQQYLRHWATCRKIARHWLAQADSILFRAPGIVSNIVWKQIRSTGRPFGIEVLGDAKRGLAKGAVRHPLLPLIRSIAIKTIKRQCLEACASAYVTERALQRDYPPAAGRFTTHYSSIELHRHQLAASPRTLFPSRGPYQIVSIGSFDTLYKAQDVLLKAIANLVEHGIDVQLSLLGDGRYRAEMQQLASDLRIANRVHFLGAVPMGDAVLTVLDQAHLYVQASRQEGLPRATIEAMARGLPCIASSVGGTPELLPPDDMVPPDDVAALTEGIAAVLRDPARMARMSTRNIQVAAGYTEDILSARRNELYRHLRLGTEAWFNRHQGSNPVQVSNRAPT